MRKRTFKTILLAMVMVASMMCAQEIGDIYASNCANCHGSDGRGNTVLGRALKVPDLHSPEVQKLSPAELAVIIGKGANRGKMPGYQNKLGADTVSKLAAFVSDIDHQSVPAISKSTTRTKSQPADVKGVYSAKCTHCHGADGSADTVLGRTLKLRDMRPPAAQHLSDDEIIAVIAHGTDHGRMAGFGKSLGPDMVQQLASYVRDLAGRPATALVQRRPTTAQAKSPAAEPLPREVGPAAADVESAKTVDGVAGVIPATATTAESKAKSNKDATRARAPRVAKRAVLPVRTGLPKSEVVDLNSASKEQLMALPGLSEAEAISIIGGRPYKSSLQFKTRGIVSAETYDKIARRVVAKQSHGRHPGSTVENAQ